MKTSLLKRWRVRLIVLGLVAVAAFVLFELAGGAEFFQRGREYRARFATGETPRRRDPSFGDQRHRDVLEQQQVALDALADARVPVVVVLAHPTTGGVWASFASLGDVTYAELQDEVCGGVARPGDEVVDLEPTFRMQAGRSLTEVQATLTAVYGDIEVPVPMPVTLITASH